MSRPETLVILTPAWPADESPVNWVTTQQLFVKTIKETYPDRKVRILTFYHPYSTGSYDWHDIRVTSFNGSRYRKIRHILFWRHIWKELSAIRRENEVAGLFSFWCGECALIGHYYGKRYGIRHYCWLCGQDARANNKLVKFIRPRPDELIAMSDFLVDEFFRNHNIRPRYMIPNGIDPGEFEPAGSPVLSDGLSIPLGGSSALPNDGTTERTIDILGVGTLSPFKQYHLFIDMIRSLQAVLPAIKGAHCGEGEDKEKIQTLIKQAGLEAHFSLLGETPHREVLRLMQQTKVLLHTSDYEGFGVVCLEALYAGAHVISFIKPMKPDIPHWHIVGTPEEMTAKARELLLAPDTDYTPVYPYLMKDTVRAILTLFDQPLYIDKSTSSDEKIVQAIDEKIVQSIDEKVVQSIDEKVVQSIDEKIVQAIGENRIYHDQAADSYDHTMEQDPANKIVRQKVREKLCSLLSSGWVLDFGGGTGLDLEWLTAQSYRVLFCEPSIAMRQKAMHYNDTILHSDHITFLDTDKTDFSTWNRELPFSPKCDAVLSDFGALNYIPDIRLLFRNMARVLQPGGHFVLLVLKLSLHKRLKWHRRNALKSLVFRNPFVLYIPYDEPAGDGGAKKQTVFVYTLKEIKEASAPYFAFGEEESLDAYDFTLIHLIRNNEKQD